MLNQPPEGSEHVQRDPPRILIVDDDSDLRTLYEIMLVRQGAQVFMARNGQEAIEQALRVRPDLILSDIMMPLMDGWEMIRRMRSDERMSHIPVVAITAVRTNAQHVSEAGFSYYLAKPVTPSILRRAIGLIMTAQD